MNEAIYHACRICWNAGNDKVPWHMVLHTLRQGLGFKGTYQMTATDFQQYPDLKDLLDQLKGIQ